jgi:hypothetical protein
VMGEQIRAQPEPHLQLLRRPVRHRELFDDGQPDRFSQRRVSSGAIVKSLVKIHVAILSVDQI